jgi:nucleotide-binding universal stress UspA family protein
MLKNPLFVVLLDSSRESEGTLAAAFALAERCGAQVHLLDAAPHRGPSVLDAAHVVGPEARASASRIGVRLEQAILTAKRDGLRVRTVTRRGEATKVITAYVQLAKASLLITGKHYGTPRWWRSPGVVSSLRSSVPVPLLVIPSQFVATRKKSPLFGHIVSAIDFTVASAVGARAIVDLSRRTGARLTLVHALKGFPNRTVFSGSQALRVAKSARGHTAQVAERLRRQMPGDVRVRVEARVTTGHPHRAILQTADEVQADLIVMGVPPRRRFDDVLFGSTLRRVLRHAKIPVLVLPVPAGAYEWFEVPGASDAADGATPSDRVRRLPRRA